RLLESVDLRDGGAGGGTYVVRLAVDESGRRFVVRALDPDDRLSTVDAYDPQYIDAEARALAEIERYGGPEVYGLVRIPDGRGGWVPAVAMEHLDGVTMQEARDRPDRVGFEITDEHGRALEAMMAAFSAD